MLYDCEGNQVPVISVVDKLLQTTDIPADSKTVGDLLFTPYTENLYSLRSQRLQLGYSSGEYNQATTLYGFYIPIDPTKGTTVTVQRAAIGTRFRVSASADEPAVGVSYHDRTDKDTSSKIVYSDILPTDRYLYIAYYSTNDTLTEAELLAGFKVYYGTEYTSRKNKIEALDYPKDVQFVNGNIDPTGLFENDSKSIVSDYIRVNGEFGVSSSVDYHLTVHLYDPDGSYITSIGITDEVRYITHFGSIRVCIADADETTDVTPSTVDFSEIKMPYNRYSPKAYTDEKTDVLDAENCSSVDVYAYLDSAVASHGMYASRTYLCTEESGLPIYYYTIGNGSKKLCIVSGQHGPGRSGDPRDSVITVAKLVHDLIDGDFADSSFMKVLHDEYTILVIPVLNVYGFNNRSRTNANDDDTNRDWTDPATIEVTAAKALITSFEPDIAFDVHTNGTTPIVNADIEIQFGLGETHNPLYRDAVKPHFMSYYNTDVAVRLPNSIDTLQYFIQNTLGIMGGLLELRWWLKDKKWMHDYQAESANYAMLLNIIKYCASVNDQQAFVFEHTPNQNQY